MLAFPSAVCEYTFFKTVSRSLSWGSKVEYRAADTSKHSENSLQNLLLLLVTLLMEWNRGGAKSVSECPVIQMSPEPLNLLGMMKSSDIGFTPRLIQLALWRDGIVRTERIRVKILKRAAESQATLHRRQDNQSSWLSSLINQLAILLKPGQTPFSSQLCRNMWSIREFFQNTQSTVYVASDFHKCGCLRNRQR